MSKPMKSSSEWEDREVFPIPGAAEGIRERIVPLPLRLLERLGTGMLFLLLVFLIVMQTIAVVAHWFGKQAIEQLALVPVFVLGAFTAIGMSYLVISGLRRWLPAPASPEPDDSHKDVDGSSRLFRASKELVKVVFFYCVLAFARPGNPAFLLIAVLATVAYLLWKRWICRDWGSAIGETLLILALGIALRLWRDHLPPPTPVRQRPTSAIHQEGVLPSGVAITSTIHSRRNSSCPDFQKI